MSEPLSAPATPRLTPARRARRALGRARGRVLVWSASARLLVQRGDDAGRSLVVVGDSHAVLLVEGVMPSRRVVPAGRSTTLVYLGPRLMHSVARDGFPTWVQRLLGTWHRSPLAGGRPTVALLLGEIDLRCHLAKPGRGDDAALAQLVRAYVARAGELLDGLGAGGQVIVVGPNAPSATYESDADFPVVGSVEERIAILDRLCAALDAAIRAAGRPALRFLDVRSEVAGEDGHLLPALTFDGCHLNSAGAALVRARLAEVGPA